MDFYILNQNFQTVFDLNKYESIIWVDRYNEPGSFELYTPITDDILTYARPDNYLMNPDSNKLMIIEDFTIESDSENGDKAKIIGRSLESILDRRIIWKQTNIDGNLQTGIKQLINENIISPTTATGGTDRRINNFIFEDSTDPAITSLKMTNQYLGENLLEVISEICKANNIGFSITLVNSNYVFKLYTGINRSYSQNVEPWVVFSPDFSNMLNSNYLEAHSGYRNVALVAGEGEGSKKKTRVVGNTAGIFRKEMYVDASGISSKDSGSAKKYVEALDQRGIEELYSNKIKREFDAQCTTQVYSYGLDYNIGDVVQFANEYGIESTSRITEFTWSYSNNGLNIYPTFESINNGIAISTGDTDVSDSEYFGYLEMTKVLNTNSTTLFRFTTTKDITDITRILVLCSIWGFVPSSVEPSNLGNGTYRLDVTFPKYKTANTSLTVRVEIS